MLSKNELRALSEISNGADNVRVLSGELDLSGPQTYKVVRALTEKEFANLRRGTVFIEKKTHIAILLDILNDSPDSYIVLSDSGLEIIKTLVGPRTVSEISSLTGLHQTTITRKIDRMRRMGMVKKEGTIYSINEELWPKMMELASSYDKYTKHIDPRVPLGSEVFHLSADLAVFSSKRALNNTKTAFSKYGDHGMAIYPGTNYYCNSDHELDIRDIFTHSLYVVENDKGWRSKMLALIFYVMHKSDLSDISHPVIDDMKAVLNGDRVDGWAPLKEMNERANVYGVDLYDI
ncbi:MAG: helix-turn-helix domain-containing protein [Methanomassiliicoccaceae archaeon]|jgi:DNA-binding MarR family transcriptional regulator|nr:helix-turn-helix domain-containing protein [Methanomassiliicoccaceae archaeon]